MQLLRFLSPQRLQTRIVAVFLGLLLLVQAISLGFIRESIDRNARSAIQVELATGERVFQRLLNQNNANLDQATRVLTADYGFRAAIASGDAATLESALLNNVERIHADLAVVADADFHLRASTTAHASAFMAAVRRYASKSLAGGNAQNQIDIIDGQPYQIVAVPVRAPSVIGWVGMGFRVDRRLLQDMGSLSGLEVALLLHLRDDSWQVSVSTLDAKRWADLSQAWVHPHSHSGSDGVDITVAGVEYSARPITLPGGKDQPPTTALLMRSVDEALAPYRQLQLSLLVLTAVGVLVFGFGSVLMARRITTPLRMLSTSARRLERGDYGAEVRLNHPGEIGELAQSFETMRQAIQAREGEIRRLAFQDALTDLPNREQFRHDLRHALTRASAEGQPCAVLMLDMDRFKHVNDVLGHRFGDRLLRAVAERLRHNALSAHDVLARLGGDEFAILLADTDAEAALPVAQRILAAFERPITLDDHTVDLGAGIGVASAPLHGLDADLLLSRAELAMYAAKQQQSGTVTYHPGLDSTSEESLTMLSDLRHAVDDHQMRLYLQPKIDLKTGQVLGGEALVRWQHPTRGMVPPMKFIPFAEQTGFVRVLTLWMIEQVAQVSEQLRAQGLRMKIAVNLSTRDLMDQELPMKLDRVLQRHHVDPRLIILEITESAIMDDPQRALATLNRLHALGVKLSIDDFGTGYSSLAYLKQLPVDELKIDKSFVLNMENDLQDAKIVRSTVDLAHNLGLSVVAEGVETKKAWKLLEALACDEAQGYYIAKPMPAAQFADWVKGWEPPDVADEKISTDFADII
jgi:diguanylate cyclase (GGDEF)-like protein